MSYQEFIKSLDLEEPPKNMRGLDLGLWHAAKGNWDMAHDITQEIHTKTASWVHAYLHRKEGDIGNAHYWYRQANKEACSGSLREELENILKNVFL